MKKRYIALSVAGLLAVATGTVAFVASPTVHRGVEGEAPELGRRGEYSIGTLERQYTFKDRTRIDGLGAVTGSLDRADRTVTVRFWYPAKPGDGEGTSYAHALQLPGGKTFGVLSKGSADAGAAPLDEGEFPLVIMSHGFGGWNTQFSNLGEHIASRGYIVASIEHADMPVDGIASFLISFGNVLVDRSLDQRQLLELVVEQAKGGTDPVLSHADTGHIGLIGYSMGGFGALATSGADYDFSKEPLSSLPEAAKERLAAANSKAAPVQALVTFAPWGGQPDNRAWTAEALGAVKVPTLMVAGSEDDVVNFEQGVTWIYDQMTGSDRYLLVYREARHNIVGNPFELSPRDPFAAHEFLTEPVWRSERLNAINQHFVTAFLDLYLKGEADKASYLDVPAPNSNLGKWEIDFGEQLNGTLAGPEQQQHWRGFQRRWAVGMEMRRKKAGE